jgi:hypothetical protein
MSCGVNCACNPQVVDLAFREAEQYIEREIRDRTYQMARYLVDYAPVKLFPDGVGYTMTKVRFYGDIGPQFDNMDGWRKEQRSRPTADAHQTEHDACGYIWEEVGHGFEELQWYLMKRDLKTTPICIEDIRTFWEYEQMQNLIYQNLANITVNMREQVNRNAIISFSVKYVLTSEGLSWNTRDPRALPNLGAAGNNRVTVGRLNFRVLKRLYNALVREAAPYALDVINGRPVFGIMASDEVIDDMFTEDSTIREDIRHTSNASSLLTRYNFMETIRGLFVVIPDLYAPRYKVDTAGNLTRVFPYEREIPIQSGTRPASNPEYDSAPYELVTILTKDIFCLRTRRAISTVGGQTNFEAETGMFEWKWHNPERWSDPNRRVGFYFANARIGIEPGDFTDIPAILVARRPSALDASFWPNPECPPVATECENVLPDQGCPCPKVVGCCEDFTNPYILQFRLTSPLDTTTYAEGEPISLRMADGGIATGVVSSIVEGVAAVAINFGEAVTCKPNWYLEVICDTPVEKCSAQVVEDKCAADGSRELRLANLLPAAVVASTEQTPINIKVLLNTNEWVNAKVTAVDKSTLTYTVIVTGITEECIVKACTPTALDATCPACENAHVPCA